MQWGGKKKGGGGADSRIAGSEMRKLQNCTVPIVSSKTCKSQTKLGRHKESEFYVIPEK